MPRARMPLQIHNLNAGRGGGWRGGFPSQHTLCCQVDESEDPIACQHVGCGRVLPDCQLGPKTQDLVRAQSGRQRHTAGFPHLSRPEQRQRDTDNQDQDGDHAGNHQESARHNHPARNPIATFDSSSRRWADGDHPRVLWLCSVVAEDRFTPAVSAASRSRSRSGFPA